MKTLTIVFALMASISAHAAVYCNFGDEGEYFQGSETSDYHRGPVGFFPRAQPIVIGCDESVDGASFGFPFTAQHTIETMSGPVHLSILQETENSEAVGYFGTQRMTGKCTHIQNEQDYPSAGRLVQSFCAR